MADGDIRMAFAAVATREPGDLKQAQQITHDNVIADLGPARTGPVSWRMVPALRGIDFLLDNRAHLGPTDDLVRFLRANPGGLLVITTAPYDLDLLTPEQRAQAEAELATQDEGHHHG